MITVKLKANGLSGPIEESDFNPALMVRVDVPSAQSTAPSTPQAPGPSLLESVGSGVASIGKSLISGPSRLGSALGTAGSDIMNRGQQDQQEQQQLQSHDQLLQKAIDLHKAGDEMGSKRFFQMAQENSQGFIDSANTRITDAQKGKEDSIKGGVGTAALLVPGGKGIGGAITSGVVSGAMAGYGSSNQDNELQSTLGGAVVGGIAGGSLHVAGNMLKRVLGKAPTALEAEGTNMRKGVVNPQVSPNDPFGYEQEQLITRKLEVMGMKGSSEAQRQQMPKVMRGLTSEIKQIFAQNPEVTFKPSEVAQTFQQSVEDLINYDATNPAYKKVIEKYTNQLMNVADTGITGADMSPEKIFDFKQNLGQQLAGRGKGTNVFLKAAEGMALTPQEEAGLAIWHSVDDLISSKLPQVKDATLSQSYLYRAAPGLFKSAAGKGPQLEVLGTKIPLPKRAVQSVTDTAGSIMQGVGKGTQKAASLMDTVGSPMFVGGDTSPLLNSGITRNLATDKIVSDANTPTGTGLGEAPTAITDTSLTEETTPTKTLNPYGASLEVIAREMENAYKAKDNKTYNHLKEMYDQEAAYQKTNGPAKKTEKQKMFSTASSGGKEALALLESGGVQTGPGQGIISAVGEKTGNITDNQVAYRSTIGLIRTAVKNALLGGQMSKQEMESIAPFIPNFFDHPNVAKQKLRTFIKLSNDMSTGSTSLPQVSLAE